jgi:hypothetical protein
MAVRRRQAGLATRIIQSSTSLQAERHPDDLCKRCRHSYVQHTKGAVPDDYCRHCACPAFVPYSPKKRKSDHGTHADLKKLFAAMGMKEPCKLCSDPNWDIYHPPDKPCPKQQQVTVTERTNG